jgi:predicted Zn-dependent protease
VFIITYIWIVPWLGERAAMKLSKDLEISMGEQMYNASIAYYTVDTGKTEMVNQFYKQLNYTVDYPIAITVVESGVVNAFAIPGGHIVIYDALLEKLKTPEELAAVLGHEISHVEKRHSLRKLCRMLARKMFLAIVFGDNSGIVNVLVDNVDVLKSLEYTPELETEADINGLRMMAKSGVDPEGMVRLMELLEKETGGVDVKNQLNTHPATADRIKNIKKQIPLLTVARRDDAELRKTFHNIFEQW